MNEWLRAVGKKIEKRREEKGMTQEQLARKVGMSTKTIGVMEAGAGNQMRKIFKVLYALEYSKPWQVVLQTRIPECSESEMKLHQSLHELLLVGGSWSDPSERQIVLSRGQLPADLLLKAIREHEIPSANDVADGKPLSPGTFTSD